MNFDFKEEIKKFQKQRKEYKVLWENKYETIYKSVDDKKQKEILILCAFDLAIDDEIELIDSDREIPDFIIKLDDIEFGVELSEITRFKEKSKQGTLQSICDDIKQKLLISFPKLKGIITIKTIDDNIDLKRENKNIFIDDTYQKIKDKLDTIDLSVESNYFEPRDFSIQIAPKMKKLECIYGDGFAMFGEELKGNEFVTKRIRNKESKIINYRKNTGIEKQALLLHHNGVDRAGDFDYEIEELIKERYQFDKIFLLNDFDKKVIVIK